MPKLPANRAQAASETELKQFDPIDPGIYVGRLAKVDAAPARNGSGNTVWNCEFDDIHTLDGSKKMPGRQWDRVTITDDGSTDWKLKQFFSAFGYTTDSDTDEMLGEYCRIHVTVREQTQGANIGRMVNNVDRLAPLMEGDFKFGGSSGGGSKASAVPAVSGAEF